LTPPRRGRPYRADVRASCRIEITLTPAELRRVRRLARANRCSVADTIRLGVLTMVADLDEDADPILVLGGRVQTIFCRE